MKTVANDGVGLGYKVTGQGPRAVVLIHGWMVSGAVWDELVEGLDKDGIKLIVPDLRGTGESDKPASGYSLQRYVEDVVSIMKAEGVTSACLVGHSMGGQIAQYLAAAHPNMVDGLVVLCTVPAAGLPLPPEAKGLFRNSGGNPSSQETILNMSCKKLPEPAKKRLLTDAGRIPVACIQESFDAWTAGGFADRLSAIRAPTLVVASDDAFLPPDFLRKAVVQPIVGARLAYIPGPGHYVQVESPLETAAVLSAFLAGLH